MKVMSGEDLCDKSVQSHSRNWEIRDWRITWEASVQSTQEAINIHTGAGTTRSSKELLIKETRLPSKRRENSG